MSFDQARVLKFEQRAEAAHWGELRPREKEALTLLVVEGKSRKEAARKMGVSESRVCELVQTARRILRVDEVLCDTSMRRLAFWMGRHWAEIEASISESR